MKFIHVIYMGKASNASKVVFLLLITPYIYYTANRFVGWKNDFNIMIFYLDIL